MGLHLAQKLRTFAESLHSHFDPAALDELVSEAETWTARLAAVESAVATLTRAKRAKAEAPAPAVEHEDQAAAPAAPETG